MASDQKFFDIYTLVVGALAIFALFILIFAMWLGDATQGQFTRESAEYKQAIANRIEPVGKAFVPGEERVAPEVVVETVPEAEPVVAALSGPQVYNQACLACHGAGIGGAPIPGDPNVWTARIAQGMEVLYDHAINGYQGEVGYMPAKGGRVDLSDEEVAAAVDYMVEESS